jgi:hypothetical protein
LSESNNALSEIKRGLPLLSKHEGVWDGWYRHYDPNGNKIDEHRSRLICRFPEAGDAEFQSGQPYQQSNFYSWPDGKTDVREFPAAYRDGRLWFDNELIDGWAAEVGLDEHHRTVMLYWKRKGDDDLYLYEMIQLSDCGKYRHRVWHWYRHGRIVSRTLIDEERASHQWRGVKSPSFAGDPL